MRQIGSRLAFSASVMSCAIALATPAFGQDQAPDDDAARAEDIVVTGSLIQRPNSVSASPITSVSTDFIDRSGSSNLEAALNRLPSLVPSGGEALNPGGPSGGRASLNLHGLGANRNLVLLDGRRLPLSDINGVVDINILPSSVIGGVDVITGGASAIYGSDAISGVVNFKTRKLSGFEADFQYGITSRGDAGRFQTSLGFGSDFADGRGYFMLAGSYNERDALGGDRREFFANTILSSFIGNGTYVPNATNLPSQAVLNSLFAGYGVTATPSRTTNLGFNNDGTLFQQNGVLNYRGPNIAGGSHPVGIYSNNVRQPVGPQGDLINRQKRKSIFAKFEYELADAIELYGQLLYVDTTTHTESGSSLTQFGTPITVPITNPFILADLRTLLASRPTPGASFILNARYSGIPDKALDENYLVQQYIGGLRGQLFGSWKYNAFVGYDESKHDSFNHFAVLKSRVQTLINASDGGKSICAGGFNPFGWDNANNLSQACIDYMSKTAVTYEQTSQAQAQLQVDGPLFKLPGGNAMLAVQASYRKNTYNYVPDSDLAAQNIEAVTATAPASGSFSVKEIAAQVDLPVLADIPFFQELSIGAAGRISDYSTSGTIKTWEADLRWRPIAELLLRGSFQRAVRAPNIGELFSPKTGIQVGFGTPPASIGDPCDIRSTARTGANGTQVRNLCLAQGIPSARIDSYIFPTTATAGLRQGNLGLSPETANTFNLGAALNLRGSAPMFRALNLSVDYYNIKIKDVISTVDGTTILSKCYNLDGSNPSYDKQNVFCQQLERDPTGDLSLVYQQFLNLGGLRTDGVEIQANWDFQPFKLDGVFYVSTNVGWMAHYKVQTLPGAAYNDFAGTITWGRGLPKWKSYTTVGYRSDAFSLGMSWNYLSRMKDAGRVTNPTATTPDTPAYSTFDLAGTARVNEAIEFRFGAKNLFDKDIPIVAGSPLGTDAAVYDILGRQFYVGARVKF